MEEAAADLERRMEAVFVADEIASAEEEKSAAAEAVARREEEEELRQQNKIERRMEEAAARRRKLISARKTRQKKRPSLLGQIWMTLQDQRKSLEAGNHNNIGEFDCIRERVLF